MRPTVYYVAITALRDRLLTSLVAVVVVAFGISAFFGSTAVIEAQEMTAVFAAGGVRVILALGLTIFVAFHVERLHESREIEALLSRSISREVFVVAYWLGVAVIAVIVVLPIAVAVTLLSPNQGGALFWSATILLECVIVVAFALFAALIMERAIPAIFATGAFYALARSVGFFLSIATEGRQAGANAVANPIFEFIALMMPRLDLMGQSRWLVYGLDRQDLLAILPAQAGIYVFLLLFAAIFDLRHKHF